MRRDDDYVGRMARDEKRKAEEDMVGKCASRSDGEGVIE